MNQILAFSARRMSLLARALRQLAGREGEMSSPCRQRLEDLSPTTGELITLASDRNSLVRSGAIWWLRTMTGEVPSVVVQTLCTALRDPNGHVVQAALGSIGVLQLRVARDAVLACLEDPSASIVHAALFALGRVGHPEDGARVLRFLGSRETHLELVALSTLAQLRYRPALPRLLERLRQCRGETRTHRVQFELPRRTIAALVAMKACEAIPLLLELAEHEVGLRGMAIQALQTLEAIEAGPALTPLLGRLAKDGHEEKRICGLIELMVRIDYRFARSEVRACLDHRAAPVRIAALQALARWQDIEAVPQVLLLIREDPSPFVRPVAVKTLAAIQGAEAHAELQELTEDTNTLVRAAVAEALGEEASPHQTFQESNTLPFTLRGDVAAARAFLKHWQEKWCGQEEVAQALQTLLRVLAG